MATAVIVPMKPAPEPEEWRPQLDYSLICRECKETPPNIIEEFASGDMVCGSCGLVLSDRIVDTRSEWRTFANDDQNNDDPSRVGEGANALLKGSQLQTSISFGESRSSRALNSAQNKATYDKTNKALTDAYREIDTLANAWSLQRDIVETAKGLFFKANEHSAFKKSQESVVACCLFLACRQAGVPRTFRELHALTRLPKKEIGRIFKQLQTFFQKENQKAEQQAANEGKALPAGATIQNSPTTEPKQLCARYASNLGLDHRITRIAEAMIDKMDSLAILAGRSPLSVASTVIFFVSHLMKQPRDAKQIAQACGVSDGTIKQIYKGMLPQADKLIDPEWIKDGKGDVALLPTLK